MFFNTIFTFPSGFIVPWRWAIYLASLNCLSRDFHFCTQCQCFLTICSKRSFCTRIRQRNCRIISDLLLVNFFLNVDLGSYASEVYTFCGNTLTIDYLQIQPPLFRFHWITIAKLIVQPDRNGIAKLTSLNY